MIKRFLSRSAVCLLLACLLAGCEFANRGSETELQADEEGRLIQTVVEPADNSIDPAELEQYVEEQIVSFNRSGEAVSGTSESSAASAGSKDESRDGIEMEFCKVKDGKIQIRINYADCSQYTAFNGTACFFGTISEAKKAGYSFERAFLNEKGKPAEDAAASIAERADEWKVLIVEEPMRLRVPDKILYTSENMKASGRTTAIVKETETESDAADARAESAKTEDASSADSGAAAEETDTDSAEMDQFVIDDFALYYVIFK